MPVRPYTRDQMWLLPPSLDDMVPMDHVVRFIASFVEQLDLTALGLRKVPAVRGGLEYDARMLLSLWLYGFMMRIRSTRRLETAARENLPLIWLLGGQHPDHSTLARFFKANREAMRNLFRQTVHTSVRVGLVGFALHAVDGTRVSTVSRDKALNREELLDLEKRAEEAIARLEGSVEAEEQSASPDPEGYTMPEALKDPEELRARIGEALAELDQREANRKSHHGGAINPKTGQPYGPEINLADPQAVQMKGRHGFVVGYNAQAAVDEKARVIVGAEVIAQATDNEALVPMLDEIEANTGRLAEVTGCDGGYHSAENLAAVEDRPTEVYVADPNMRRKESKSEKALYHKDAFVYDAETDTYRCPAGKTLVLEQVHDDPQRDNYGVRVYRCKECRGCPHRDSCTKDKSGRRIRVRPQDALLRQNREKMRTERGKEMMRRRAATVEPVFAVMREHMGLSRFLRRGLENVRAEWLLLCAAYNLRVIWQAWKCKAEIRAVMAV
ncbi:MAG: IS1182 family transposase [Anaerolineae bacterium]|nr:IS1182 family transposase [Anaerolineae bacterium]